MQELTGKLRPPAQHGVMKGAMLLLELDPPYQGIAFAVMSDETRGRSNARKRLGRDLRPGDELTIVNYEIGSESVRVLEVV